MTRLLFAIIALAFFTSLCFAQKPAVPLAIGKNGNLTPLFDNAPSDAPEATITFTGRINYVSSGYIMSGASRQINIIDESGLETIFIVGQDTTVVGKDGGKITLNWLSKNDKVSIEYITDLYGIKMVKSIKVLAGW